MSYDANENHCTTGHTFRIIMWNVVYVCCKQLKQNKETKLMLNVLSLQTKQYKTLILRLQIQHSCQILFSELKLATTLHCETTNTLYAYTYILQSNWRIIPVFPECQPFMKTHLPFYSRKTKFIQNARNGHQLIFIEIL